MRGHEFGRATGCSSTILIRVLLDLLGAQRIGQQRTNGAEACMEASNKATSIFPAQA